MHCWFQGSRLGKEFGQNLLDQHDRLAKRHLERRWTRDPLGRDNHVSWRKNPPLQVVVRMKNRLQKATGVFEKWSSTLCDATLDLSKRILCFRASVLSSLGWQSGSDLSRGRSMRDEAGSCRCRRQVFFRFSSSHVNVFLKSQLLDRAFLRLWYVIPVKFLSAVTRHGCQLSSVACQLTGC